MKNSPERIGYEALEAALRYCRELGWSVIPIYPPVAGDNTSGKKPIGFWKDQATTALTENEIVHRFGGHRDAGVAVICGGVSKLIAVDGDSAEALDFIRSKLPVTPLVSRTGKGEHHFYRWPGFAVPPGAKLKGMALDLRGDGSYVVAPPSRHWSGKTYQWVVDPTKELLKELPLFDPAWIAEPRKYERREPKQTTLSDFDRAALWLAATPGAVSKKGGHNMTFRVACRLTHPRDSFDQKKGGFGLSFDQALGLMLVWNAKCEPPWSIVELKHKVEDSVRLLSST